MEMGSRKGAGRGPPWRRRVDPDLRRRAKPAWRSGEKWGRCEQDGEPGAGAQPAAPLLQASGPTWAEESPQAVGTRGSAGSACERGRWGGATAGCGAPRRLGPQPGGRGPTPCGRRPVRGGPLSARLSPSGDATQAIRLRLPLLKRFDQNRRPCRAEPRWPQSGTPRCGF